MDSLRYAGQIVQSHSLKDAYIVQIGYYSSTHPTRCVRRADRVLPTRCVRRADRVLQQHTSYTLRTSCRLGTTAAHILHAAYVVQIGYYGSTHPTRCIHRADWVLQQHTSYMLSSFSLKVKDQRQMSAKSKKPSRIHYNTYSYKVTSINDAEFFSFCKQGQTHTHGCY